MSQQVCMNLPVSQRTVLVTVDTARAVLGVDAESVVARIEAGEIAWAWDISAREGGVRELRIWARELLSSARHLTEEQVLRAVMGTDRERLRGTEVCAMLLCSRPHVWALVQAGLLTGELVGNTQWIWRGSLEGFLRRRRQ